MSCDGLYLISLKGPQATAAARQGNACVGPCTLSCYPPPFFLTQTKRRTRDADGMESLAMQSILLGARQGRLMIPAEAQGAASGLAWTTAAAAAPAAARSRGLAWEKIRQPKKPFPSLPCFWSGRRPWNASSFPSNLSTCSPDCSSYHFPSKQLLIIFSPFHQCRRRGAQLPSIHCMLTLLFLCVGPACETWL